MNLNLNIDKAHNLKEIEAIIANCTLCPLYKTKTKDVPGSGNPKAEIMFVGEAPGKEEDISGEPFVGISGKFLTELIESIGLKRNEVFTANTVKHRPPKNRDPKPDEKAACLPYLMKQIEIIKPKLIVLVGRHAMETFLPGLKISEAHGEMVMKENQAYLPLYHPFAALTNGKLKASLIEDFGKIPSLLKEIKSKQ